MGKRRRKVEPVERRATLELLERRLLLSGVVFDLPGPQYPVGSSPASVAAADLDGDGDLDLVAANYNSHNVSVLRNQGDGTFGLKTDYSVGFFPNSVSAADVTGDGHVDLVTANYLANTVSVLRNLGTGLFAPKVDYAVGTQPSSVVSFDVDNDGDIDVITSNYFGGNVSVLRNQGNGTFAAHVTYQTGSNPYSVAAADVDGDGHKDLVVGNSGSNSVSVLRNLGNGTFAAGVNYAVGRSPVSVAAADVDGDGHIDVVAVNNLDNTVSVLRNLGNGTLDTQVVYAAGNLSESITIADLDADGDVDLIVANTGASTVSVLLNAGNGTFASPVDYVVGTHPSFVTTADVNGDGRPDVMTTNRLDRTVSVLLNETPPPEPQAPLINTVSPDPVTGSDSEQSITLDGSGFQSGAMVRLRDLTNGGTFLKIPTTLTASRITVSANFTTATATWSAEVINPADGTSNTVTFTVMDPVFPGTRPDPSIAPHIRFVLPLAEDSPSHFYFDRDVTLGTALAWNGLSTDGDEGGAYDGHRGTDFSGLPRGTSVYAAASGILVEKVDGLPDGSLEELANPNGNYVRIHHGDDNTGTPIYSVYLHFNAGSVTTKPIGSFIAAGELIGGIGTSGRSSGLHLHFETQWGSPPNRVAFDPYAAAGETSWWTNVPPDPTPSGDFGNSPAEAFEINPFGTGHTIGGAIQTASDEDWFQFASFGNEVLQVSATGSVSVAVSDGFSTLAPRNGVWNLGTGTYYIYVTGNEGDQYELFAQSRLVPVILVHGILGSEPKPGHWVPWLGTWAAGADKSILDSSTWASMLTTLTGRSQHEYTLGKDLFNAVYDWRQSIFDPTHRAAGTTDSGAEYLREWILTAEQQWVSSGFATAAFQVDILAHSMGGLVAREYIQNNYYDPSEQRQLVQDFITVGTPHEGAAVAYLVYDALREFELTLDVATGDYTSAITQLAERAGLLSGPVGNILKTLIGLTDVWGTLINLGKDQAGLPTAFDELFPSLKQMFPIDPFIKYSSNLLSVPFTPLTIPVPMDRNTWLESLNADFSWVQGDNAKVSTFTVVGNEGGGFFTNKTIDRIWDGPLGVGTPIPLHWTAGDAFVPADSALLRNYGTVDRRIVIGDDEESAWHIALPNDLTTLSHVIPLLGLGLTTIRTSNASGFLGAIGQVGTNLGWMVIDPAEGYVENSVGLRVGSTVAGGLLNEIPNAWYSGPADVQFMLLPTTAGDIWTFDPVQVAGDYSYHIITGYLGNPQVAIFEAMEGTPPLPLSLTVEPSAVGWQVSEGDGTDDGQIDIGVQRNGTSRSYLAVSIESLTSEVIDAMFTLTGNPAFSFVETGTQSMVRSLAMQDVVLLELEFTPNIGGSHEAQLVISGVGQSTLPDVVIELTASSDAVLPTVAEVLVRATTWSSNFLDFLSVSGLGNEGYALPLFLPTSLLPWERVNQLIVRFNEDIDLASAQLRLFGVNTPELSGAWWYDPSTFTATWNLDSSLTLDKWLVQLTGVTDLVGNPMGGDDFTYRFDVLPGDVDRSGGVSNEDVNQVRALQFSSAGSPGYDPMLDVDGSGMILSRDVILVRNRMLNVLPTGEPQVAVGGSGMIGSSSVGTTVTDGMEILVPQTRLPRLVEAEGESAIVDVGGIVNSNFAVPTPLSERLTVRLTLNLAASVQHQAASVHRIHADDLSMFAGAAMATWDRDRTSRLDRGFTPLATFVHEDFDGDEPEWLPKKRWIRQRPVSDMD